MYAACGEWRKRRMSRAAVICIATRAVSSRQRGTLGRLAGAARQRLHASATRQRGTPARQAYPAAVQRSSTHAVVHTLSS